MKSGKTLVDILMKKRNYEKVSLLGPQTVEARLSKQCLGFMLRALPNLKCLIICKLNVTQSSSNSRMKNLRLLENSINSNNSDCLIRIRVLEWKGRAIEILPLYTRLFRAKKSISQISMYYLTSSQKWEPSSSVNLESILDLAPIGVNEMKRILDVLPGLEVLDIKTVKNAPIQFF